MPKAAFTNPIGLYAASMRKIFRVTHVCDTMEEANEECRRNPGIGLIMQDEAGRHYLADLYGSVCPSAIMADLARNPPKVC